MIPLDPASIDADIELAKTVYGLFEALVARLKARGVTDEQIAAISDDYRVRIARREAEAK